MVNERKGKLGCAGLISIGVVALVGPMIRFSSTTSDIVQNFDVDSDFALSLLSILIAVVAGMLTHFIFTRFIKIDEI